MALEKEKTPTANSNRSKYVRSGTAQAEMEKEDQKDYGSDKEIDNLEKQTQAVEQQVLRVCFV